MSRDDEPQDASRRRLLQAAAAMAPLAIASRVAAAFARPQLGDDWLDIGARDVVARNARGYKNAET
jgi:hypothetical protein